MKFKRNNSKQKWIFKKIREIIRNKCWNIYKIIDGRYWKNLQENKQNHAIKNLWTIPIKGNVKRKMWEEKLKIIITNDLPKKSDLPREMTSKMIDKLTKMESKNEIWHNDKTKKKLYH